ncbi:hypothetical protein AVEN_45963-1 [Araneus ventricosus]|uniref:Smoothelin domain-containing protein n=1 Tax=Araneus ventricosus TaxID=182803 RepID=A0A4Y2GAP6_ARAVE|nr:hypothetical protein AVEN_45963-1 [Araneus ventricosus]
MQHQEYEEEEEEEEIDLESIEDEQTLIDMLDETEDIDERKKIRDRLRQVQYVLKAQKEEQRKKRENEREQRIRDRQKEADLKKKQTLQMYSDMAKQGGPPRQISQDGEKKKDLVEDCIRDRVKACDDRKKRILAAFDHAAKSQPAGGARIVEFDSFKSADVSKLEPRKPVRGSCTFGMSGGVPKVEKPPVASAPRTPVPDDDSHLDPMERAIRARVREADERKKRTLAAYDMVARTGGAGPKTVFLEEFRNIEMNDKPKPKYDPCFRGGLKT